MPGLKFQVITKIHLFISVVIVLLVSIYYGFFPDDLFRINPSTIDEANQLKGTMGLYMAFAIFWTLALFRQQFLKPALISHMLFMIGLGLGRSLSVILDGRPSQLLYFGVFGELLLGAYGLWVVINYHKISSKWS